MALAGAISTHWMRAMRITLGGLTLFWMIVQDLSKSLQKTPWVLEARMTTAGDPKGWL